LHAGLSLDLPADTSRHIQVLRLQPGAVITLFDGRGGEYQTCILQMGRHTVTARIDSHQALERESAVYSHVVMGMPANERMDWLVEKATELGVQRITPLMSQNSVLRLQGERADKKLVHWQAVAISACEQCGRNTLPQIDALQNLSSWLQSDWVAHIQNTQDTRSATKAAVLSLHPSTQGLSEWATKNHSTSWLLLNGPEGGLTDEEDELARTKGFVAVNLGARVLRAETAALAALAYFNVRG
jgi:16S rRNA (uracil1498-N3)-methyltransferase